MKKIIIILLLIYNSSFTLHCQDVPASTEQQLEERTELDQSETEDDSYLVELEQFKKNPVNLNTADANELEQLRMLTGLQISNLISYRKLLGRFINIYELQAIPALDIHTIRKLLPFVTITTTVSLPGEFGKRFNNGDHSLLIRLSQTLERSKGFDHPATGTKYPGSPKKIMVRYRYNYKNLLQFGLVAEKDAGEQFFKGAQGKGFDFYSFHLFARKIGIIQSLAIGDFIVNMGQGLIQWQGLAFKKSSDVSGIKRQSAILMPYNSAGEFYFGRGAGITVQKRKIEATAFASFRKLSANLIKDTINHEDHVSSFLTSGYNRTIPEIADRNDCTQISFGGNINYRTNRWQIGINGVQYNFSLFIQKRNEPYNLYAIRGKSWTNFSLDYSYTYRNLHFFGEAAADKNLSKAFINGVLMSADAAVDISVVYRSISKEYQALYGNTFSENTNPTNEKGLYAGTSIHPWAAWRLDAYCDFYQFPWLKYMADAPARGRDLLVQLTYIPNKQLEFYSRLKLESKQSNQPGNNTTTNYLIYIPKLNWRTQVGYKVNNSVMIRNRLEVVWYDKNGAGQQTGFLSFFDLYYKPVLKPYSGNLRLQYFETNGYDSRIYAYEQDVLYSYSIPAFYDQGFRYYLNINYDLSGKISFWLRLSQTVYRNKTSIGSGLDEIPGNHRTEVKLEGRWLF